ncbi:MAG: NAD-dependent protein deacylase [Candidatus Zixiibacteriota bacterium]|nr:MAG: NAD-dependent protein deacylase [candidate division Zixibacteria bacterium]
MLEEIANIARNCQRCVVLTGAGISAESGVPTFRGKDGLWGKFKPEELATMDAFLANPKVVWEWYNWRRQIIGEVKPNPGHYALCELEEMFTNFTLVTQNVDGLHRVAGSRNILELHGNINLNKCVECSQKYPDDLEINPDDIPGCPNCGGQIRPDVVWFGEMLDATIISQAFDKSAKADLFFSIGTSTLVHPAASLPLEAKRSGATLVEINIEATPLTTLADFHIAELSGVFLPNLLERIKSISA